MTINGLIQIVEDTTRKNNSLDLVITNVPSKVQQVTTMPGISDYDYDTVFVELGLSPVTHTQTPRKFPLYKKARLESMKEDMATLHQTTKSMAENNTDINTIWDKFTTTLKTSIQQHTPHKTARPRETSPWIGKYITKTNSETRPSP
jgi:hypothetical protein